MQALAPIFRAELQAYQGKYQTLRALREGRRAAEGHRLVRCADSASVSERFRTSSSRRWRQRDVTPPSTWSSESPRVA